MKVGVLSGILLYTTLIMDNLTFVGSICLNKINKISLFYQYLIFGREMVIEKN